MGSTRIPRVLNAFFICHLKIFGLSWQIEAEPQLKSQISKIISDLHVDHLLSIFFFKSLKLSEDVRNERVFLPFL